MFVLFNYSTYICNKHTLNTKHDDDDDDDDDDWT